MAKVDSYHNIAPQVQIAPAQYTSTQTPSSGVDLQGYESASWLISTGVVTDGTWTVTFQESNSASSNFNAIDPSNLIGSAPGPFTSSGFNNKVYKVGYIGQMRYIRAVVTKSGGSTGAIFGVLVERGAPHVAPTPDDPNA